MCGEYMCEVYPMCGVYTYVQSVHTLCVKCTLHVWSIPYVWYVPYVWSTYVSVWSEWVLTSVSSFTLKTCGNNGQGDPVDNLYLKWVKSTLTGHKQKHLHLYQINGRSRLGSSGADPIQVETRILNNFMWNRKLVAMYKNGGKMNGTKNMIK
jgi:hypothetical protein